MSLHLTNSLTHSIKASAATTSIAAIQSASNGTIEIDASLYTLLAVALSMVGIVLARLVTIDAENKRLGRRQTWRETGPLTWIAVLIVCPFIWHYEIAVPWAALIGLGVGYSVRVILRILGDGAQGAARAMAARAVDSLKGSPPDRDGLPQDMKDLVDRIDQADSE